MPSLALPYLPRHNTVKHRGAQASFIVHRALHHQLCFKRATFLYNAVAQIAEFLFVISASLPALFALACHPSLPPIPRRSCHIGLPPLFVSLHIILGHSSQERKNLFEFNESLFVCRTRRTSLLDLFWTNTIDARMSVITSRSRASAAYATPSSAMCTRRSRAATSSTTSASSSGSSGTLNFCLQARPKPPTCSRLRFCAFFHCLDFTVFKHNDRIQQTNLRPGNSTLGFAC